MREAEYQQSLKRKFYSLISFCVFLRLGSWRVGGGCWESQPLGIFANSLELCCWRELLPLFLSSHCLCLLLFPFFNPLVQNLAFAIGSLYTFKAWSVWPSLLNLIGQGSLKYLKVYSPGITVCVVYIYIYMYWHISAFNQKKKPNFFVQVFFNLRLKNTI